MRMCMCVLMCVCVYSDGIVYSPPFYLHPVNSIWLSWSTGPTWNMITGCFCWLCCLSWCCDSCSEAGRVLGGLSNTHSSPGLPLVSLSGLQVHWDSYDLVVYFRFRWSGGSGTLVRGLEQDRPMRDGWLNWTFVVVFYIVLSVYLSCFT